MSEPTYEFVKGQGWVVVNLTRTFIADNGDYVTLILRKPELGERFFNNHAMASPDLFTPEEILDEMQRSLTSFSGKGVLWDDYCGDKYPQSTSPYNVVVIRESA